MKLAAVALAAGLMLTGAGMMDVMEEGTGVPAVPLTLKQQHEAAIAKKTQQEQAIAAAELARKNAKVGKKTADAEAAALGRSTKNVALLDAQIKELNVQMKAIRGKLDALNSKRSALIQGTAKTTRTELLKAQAVQAFKRPFAKKPAVAPAPVAQDQAATPPSRWAKFKGRFNKQQQQNPTPTN